MHILKEKQVSYTCVDMMFQNHLEINQMRKSCKNCTHLPPKVMYYPQLSDYNIAYIRTNINNEGDWK